MEIAVEDLGRMARLLQESAEQFISALQALSDNTATETPVLLGPKRARTMPPISVFVAENYFCDMSTVDGVNIYFVSEGFKRDFLGVEEVNVPEVALSVRKMKKGADGEAVNRELGKAQDIALGHVWELLKIKSKPFIVARCYGQFVWAHWRIDREGWSIGICPLTSRRLKLEVEDVVVTG